MRTLEIGIKRIYETFAPSDGIRVLADRIWPRGIKKADARLDHWAKVIAPSTELRKWFAHDPAKWEQFHENYTHELDAGKETAGEIDTIRALAGGGKITLLYAAHDSAHNNAVVLKDYIERKSI